MAYLRLIWTYYDTESPLPNAIDKLAFQVGSSSIDVQLILEHFFTLEEGWWHHRRCDAEINAYKKRSAKSQKAASVRWSNAESCPEHSRGMPGACPEHEKSCQPITDNREPITNKKQDNHLSGKPDDCPLFDEFWSSYPRKEDKKKAKTAFCRLSTEKKRKAADDCSIRYVGTEKQYIPLPTTYIHGERWDDEIKAAPSQKKAPKPDNFDGKDYGEGGLL